MRVIIIAILVIVLTSCALVPESTPTETPIPTNTLKIVPTSTATFTPIPSFTSTPISTTSRQPTLLPTQLTMQAMRNPTIVVLTPSQDQLERWREYEKALGMAVLPPRLRLSDVICEWRILGQSGQEVYVYVSCTGYRSSNGLSDGSLPAVIVFGANGDVQGVKTAENSPVGDSYSDTIRKLFPPDVLEKIDNIGSIDGISLHNHLTSRRANPEPPLIVLDATTTPGTP